MTTSTNDTSTDAKTGPESAVETVSELSKSRGALADGLTLIRALLTPVIMFIILKAWAAKPGDPDGYVTIDIKLALLATVLFAIAAFSDLLDDFVGGSAHANERRFGWFDDIADSILINGSLLALVWALGKAKMLHWSFAVPVLLIFARDIFVGLRRGYEMSKFGFLETRLGDLKSALLMLATCILVAAPWLSGWVDQFRASKDNVMQVYGGGSPVVWNTGLTILWLAALLALYTGWQILISKIEPEKKAET